MPSSVIAILAHPDDAEFLCAGALIRLSRECDFTIHIATMTAGDCGSVEYPPLEIANIRRAEAGNAAALMNATYHCLEQGDMRVTADTQTVETIVRLLAKVRPDLVITHSPDDYHPDHEATSRAVRTATFAAPIPNYLHGGWDHPPLSHIPHLYYCDPLEGKDIFGMAIEPSLRIDVSKTIELKEKMLAAHASQRNWLLKHHGVDDYLISMRAWGAKQAQALNQATGLNTSFAEGFRQHLGHSYPQNDLLLQLIGGTAGDPASL
jgi:N-acetylglucosamine malate deacetylase 1